MSWDDDVYTCSSCGRDDLVLASGPRKAKILIIGEQPEDDDIKKGKPLSGKMGYVLKSELGRVSLDANQMRLTNLWLHPAQKVSVKNIEGQNIKTECFKQGLDAVIKEAKNRQAILLIGSETVKFFCNEKVSEVSGLVVESTYLSAPLVFACVKPTSVFSGGLGEVRQALSKFSLKIGEITK